jgi:hypothetical protein
MGIHGFSQFHSFRLGKLLFSSRRQLADRKGNVRLNDKPPTMSISNYELGIVFPLRELILFNIMFKLTTSSREYPESS